jgi:Tfp pilus assembly protein PilF
MELKEFLTRNRLVVWLLTLLSLLVIGGCALQPAAPPPAAPGEDAVQPAPGDESPPPQQAAARELTARGRRLLENTQPDAAIRDLERALNLDPSDGQTYYYLAEAWLMKIDARRAEAFNRKAENLLKDDPVWLLRIARQADRIAELEQ